MNFNPRSLTGATIQTAAKTLPTRFQSTLPHGSDNASSVKISNNVIFQSTLPHGSDLDGAATLLLELISIHAPSRERLYQNSLRLLAFAFQSTLPHGSDSVLEKAKCLRVPISIHAPSRERRY